MHLTLDNLSESNCVLRTITDGVTRDFVFRPGHCETDLFPGDWSFADVAATFASPGAWYSATVVDGATVTVLVNNYTDTGNRVVLLSPAVYSERELFWYGFATLAAFMGVSLMLRPVRAIGRTWVD